MSNPNTNPGNLPTLPVQVPDKTRYGFLPHQKAITPADAIKLMSQRKGPPVVFTPNKPHGLLAASPSGAPSIAEQARALKNNVDLIYEFIYDNVDFLPNYGLHKGGLGSLIDGCGNAFDQCDLMVQLLRQAGYTANYVFGVIKLTPAQWSNWLGTSQTDSAAASQILSDGGIGNAIDASNNISLNHCWVQVTIGGTNYVFDPSLKTYTYTSGIDLAAAMSYSRTNFLNDATTGATVTADYVQNINQSNINADLTTYSMNLVSWIKQNMSGATLDQILGGRSIVPTSGTIRNTSLPYQDTSYGTIITNVVPTNYKATLQVQYDFNSTTQKYNVDTTFYTADVYTKRLTLWFDTNLAATLYLDGTAAGGPSSAQASGSATNAVFTVKHPYPSTFADTTQTVQVNAGAQTTIGTAFGFTGSAMAARHQEQQNQSIADGLGASTEAMLGQSLLLIWDNYMGQASAGTDFLARMGNATTIVHHFVGTVAQYNTGSGSLKIINSFMSSMTLTANSSGTDETPSGFATSMLVESLEGSANGQTTGVDSASVPRLISNANSAGKKIYNATSANWTTGANVQAAMQADGYPAAAVTSVGNFVASGWRVAVPDTANIALGSFTNFYAYLALGSNNASMSGYTWFGAKGGVAGSYQDDPTTNSAVAGTSRQVNEFGLPAVTASETAQVSMQNGRYEYSSTDLVVGNQGTPYQLAFVRSYNSALRLAFQDLGFGWCHNWQMQATEANDAFIPFGDQQVSAAATSIATLFVVRDVALSNTSMPINNWVVACVAQTFLANQLSTNVVRLQTGAGFLVFTKMPDGTYLPPMGAHGASTLTKTAGAFKYTTPDQVVYSYNTTGTIASIAYPFGVTLTFTYGTNGKLSKVTNGWRSLNFSYDIYNQLSTIDDGNGRTVTLTLPYANGNLTAVRDPVGNSTTYNYDQRGRLTQVFKPAHPTTAVTTTVYDSLSRVEQQTDAYSNHWSYYFAGARSEEVAPDGTSRICYFNDLGLPIRSIDGLGEESDTTYDGNGRVVRSTQPEGNGTSNIYDGMGNVISITVFPKPGSPLTSKTTTLTYDPAWNKLASATDPANNTTTTTYAAPGTAGAGRVIRTQSPAVAAGTPVSTFAYNTLGQVISTTDPTGNVIAHSYDSVTHNLLSSTADASGLNITSQYSYDAVGNLTSITDPIGKTTTYTYDNNRRLTQETGPAPYAYQAYLTYDGNGNLLSLQSLNSNDPNSVTTTLSYSVDNRLLSAMGPLNYGAGPQPVPVTYAYDALRRLVTVTDASGNVATAQLDALGRATSSSTNGVVRKTITFTANGKVHTLTDEKSNVSTFAYDGFDRLVTATYPDSSTESFSYDGLNNLLQMTNRKAQTYTYTYDALGQLTSKVGPTGPVTSIGYDLAGRQKSVSVPTVAGDLSTGTFTTTFDQAGRPTAEQYPDGKTLSASSIDGNGNILTLQYPGTGSIIRTFDGLNRMLSLSGIGGNASYTFDSASRCISQYNGNGTGQGFWFDKDDSLLGLSIGGLKSSSFGNPARIDIAYRLSNTEQTVDKRSNDPNLLWEPQTMVSTTYGAANSLNQYPSVNGSTLTYDGNGNLTSDGTNTYGYDNENRLISVVTPSQTVTYKYDPLGRLSLKSSANGTVRYIYWGFQRVEERDGNDVLIRRYVYGPGTDNCLFSVDGGSGAVTYLHTDETGSVVLLTDQSGTPIVRNVFKPWGELASGSLSTVPIGFTGQFYDVDTGLYYYKARFYSPSLGRFLQPDPSGYGAGLNLYEYCAGDPVNLADPTGLDYEEPVSSFQLPVFALQTAAWNIDVAVAQSSAYVAATYATLAYQALGAWDFQDAAWFLYQFFVAQSQAAAAAARAASTPPAAAAAPPSSSNDSSLNWSASVPVVAPPPPPPPPAYLQQIAAPFQTIFGKGIDNLHLNEAGGAVGLAMMITPGGGVRSLLAKYGLVGLESAGFGLASSTVASLSKRAMARMVAQGVKGGVYEFIAADGLPYIGQSVNVTQRIYRHILKGKLLEQDIHTVIVYPVSGGKTALNMAERTLLWIRGGIGMTSNKNHPPGL